LIKAAESEYFKYSVQDGKAGYIPCSAADWGRKLKFEDIIEEVILPNLTAVSILYIEVYCILYTKCRVESITKEYFLLVGHHQLLQGQKTERGSK